jgi:dTDP-4-dehydrorhamnose reductase
LGEIEAKRYGTCLICRIPALFRPNTTSRGNWVTKLAEQFSNGEVVSLDAKTVRYYTAADDIAKAVIFLADSGFDGICHLSSEKQTTKAGFARIVARQLGFSEDLVKDCPPPESDGIDRRPHDSHLDTSKYKSLNGPALRDYDVVLSNLK